jgi:cytochrome b involved in lipid metabolism
MGSGGRETTTPSTGGSGDAATDRMTGGAGAPQKYTTVEVEKHATPEDCWVIVHSKVYDVTTFVPRHPGGNMVGLYTS